MTVQPSINRSGSLRLLATCLPKLRSQPTIAIAACLITLLGSSIATAQSNRDKTVSRSASNRAERTLRLQRKKYSELHDRFVVSLEKLSEWCEEFNQPEGKKTIRALIQPIDGQILSEADLPATKQPPLDRGLPEGEREWRSNLRRMRTKYASDLYRLSREVLRAGYPSFAFDLVREVAIHDPDHKQTRALLGYVSYFDQERKSDIDYHGEWVSPFAARMMSGPKRHVWDDRFGWILKTHLPRYENGQRPWKGKWISADREAEARRDFKNAWEVRTDHFLVKTNYSLERGVEIAQKLENFHSFFVRTFAPFFETPKELEKRFSEASSRRRTVDDPYEVHYYATRDEYNRRLIDRIPRIQITTGLYYQVDQTCFFFNDPEADNDHTLFHEATHQFLDVQTARQRKQAAVVHARKTRQKNIDWSVAPRDNFWVIEGFACYIESFRQANGMSTLGDQQYPRFQVARFRMLKDGYYIPLASFSEMGMMEFQRHKEIRKNYSQAAGLVHFLMHYHDGEYRDGLIEYLSQIYRPNSKQIDRVPSIAQILDVSYKELDEQYRQYISSLPGPDPAETTIESKPLQ